MTFVTFDLVAQDRNQIRDLPTQCVYRHSIGQLCSRKANWSSTALVMRCS